MAVSAVRIFLRRFLPLLPDFAGCDAEFLFEGGGETVVITETEHFCNVTNREDGFLQ